MDPAAEAVLVQGRGIAGNANQGGKRQVTVIAEDAWREVERELGAEVDPRSRRANVMVRGLDLEESLGSILRLGECAILVRGATRPCELMDEMHPGLRAALARHWRGGVYGEIVDGGVIRLGDGATLERPVTAAS